MNKFWRHYGVGIVIICVILLWFGTLQYRYLISPDEGRYAEIAREMVQTGDWITPHLNDFKYFEKPALQYWMSALFFKLFGFSDFVARLWPALTGFLAAFFIGLTARGLWNKETGYIATLVLLSMVWWVGNSHFLSLDAGLSAFLAIGLGSFLLAQREEISAEARRNWMLLSWTAIALATLSKGLIGIVIPGATLFLYTLWQWDWRLWGRLHLGKGIVLFLLITAPWFILVSLRNPTFAYFFFIEEHFLRYSTNVSRRAGPWYYFVLPLLVGSLPWLSFLPQTVKQISYKRTATFSPEKFLLLWAIFVFVFFSLSYSKLPSYILPLFPAMALLMARFIQKADAAKLRLHARLLIAPALLLLVGAVIMYFLPAKEIRVVANQQFALWLSAGGIVFLLCAAGAVYYARLGKKWGVILCFTAAGLIAVQIPMLGHRSYGAQHSGYFLAEEIKPHIKADTPLYIVGFYDQTLPYYLQRTLKLVEYFDEFTMGLDLEPEKKITLGQFMIRWQAEPDAVAIMQKNRYDDLQAQGMRMKIIARTDNELAVAHYETD